MNSQMYNIVCESVSIQENVLQEGADGIKAAGKIVASLVDNKDIENRNKRTDAAVKKVISRTMSRDKPGFKRAFRVAATHLHGVARKSGIEDLWEAPRGTTRYDRGLRKAAITAGKNAALAANPAKALITDVGPSVALPVADVVKAGFGGRKKKKKKK